MVLLIFFAAVFQYLLMDLTVLWKMKSFKLEQIYFYFIEHAVFELEMVTPFE